MHGYDTVVIAASQPKGLERSLWEGEQVTVTQAGRQVKRWMNLADVQFTQVQGPFVEELRAQASLPKLIYGDNVRCLDSDRDVFRGLELVDQRAQENLGVRADWVDGELRRVDVTADRQLKDEALVSVALARLAITPLRGRYPVRGESGSVSWPRKRGSFTRKAYSKHEETGSEVALGLLRAEVGCMGQKSLRKVLLRKEAMRAEELAGTTGLRLREKVGGEMSVFLEEHLQEVSDVKLYDAFRRFREGHRTDRASALVGYSMLVKTFGWGFLEAYLSRQSIWQVKRDLKAAEVRAEELEWESGEGRPYAREAGGVAEAFLFAEEEEEEPA